MISDKEFRILKGKLEEVLHKMKDKGHNMWDIEPNNVFIDTSKKPYKLYFSDPIFVLPPESYSSFVDKYNKNR